MKINNIPQVNLLKAHLGATSKENKKSNKITKNFCNLPGYNSSICFHPSFCCSIISSANSPAENADKYILKQQSESPLYAFDESKKENWLPEGYKGVFNGQQTNIIGMGNIFKEIFNMQEIFDLYFRERKNINAYDPKLLEDGADQEGYNVLPNFESIESGSAFILTPNRFHVDQVEALSKKENLDGVYVEKPMCTTEEELERLKKIVQTSKTPLYFGDYFYFAQIPALRLMGVDMPYKDSVCIEFDNSANKKFTNSIENAIPFFKPEEISSINTRFREEGIGLDGRDMPNTRTGGGGILLDMQIHVSNLLNLMGLELNEVTEVIAKKHPCGPARGKSSLIPLEEGDAEDGVIIKGKINGSINVTFDVAQYMDERANTIIIESKNGQKIKITVDDFEKKVELLDENDNTIACAKLNVKSYGLMIHHAQTFFNEESAKKATKMNDNKTPGINSSKNKNEAPMPAMFFDTQEKTLKQIFEIIKIIDKQNQESC